MKDQDPTEWISKGMKLMKKWLTPEQGADQMVEKIAVEQFLNGLPQEMRIWVTSQNPGTPSRVAELMESYETAHSRGSEKTRPKQDYKPSFKPKSGLLSISLFYNHYHYHYFPKISITLPLPLQFKNHTINYITIIIKTTLITITITLASVLHYITISTKSHVTEIFSL